MTESDWSILEGEREAAEDAARYALPEAPEMTRREAERDAYDDNEEEYWTRMRHRS